MNKQEISAALYGFINQIYWAEDLRPDESIKNLEESVVELTMCGRHSSNGLMITEDGYFLTAKHCIDGDIRYLQVRLSNGRSYNISHVCVQSDKEDVALVKAEVPGRCRPKKYRIFNTNKIKSLPAAIMLRKDGKVNTKHGFMKEYEEAFCYDTNQKNRKYPEHHFQLQLMGGKPGDSGGVVVDTDGRLIGILSGGIETSANGIKIMKALEFIDLYIRKRLLD